MKRKVSFAAICFLVAMWFGLSLEHGGSPESIQEVMPVALTENQASLAANTLSKASNEVDVPRREVASQPDPFDAFQKETKTPFVIERDPFSGRVILLRGGVYSKIGESPEEFLKKRSLALFGVAPEKLKPMKTVETDQKKIIFQQFEGDRPVFGQTVSLIYEGDQLVRIQNDLQPITASEPVPVADSIKEAFEIYARSLDDGTQPRLVSAEDLLFPYGQGQSVAAYRFHTNERVNGVEGQFEVLFDAENLRVIRKRSSRIE